MGGLPGRRAGYTSGMSLETDALRYHSTPRPGKIEVVPSKPCLTQRDLSLAYTPGVAAPCLEIEKNPDLAYDYTARGNLVAVISNGTAVLGLGDIGALAGKPVMEGKGVLFKRFAGIDVFDIEVKTHDPEEFINAVRLLEPTFGGNNLEDIKAPECFQIEQRLQESMDIPVFHDDQHGTAIISGAALINAAMIQGKAISDLRVVISGAGAAGIACAKFYVALGVRPENIIMLDSVGVIHRGRTQGMNPYKSEFAVDTKARTLAEALVGADVFSGLSKGGLLTGDMIKAMAPQPLICAMANPTPEIFPDVAHAARPDAIVATGRSDFPNQVNNVLGFPFIFRGALDVRARRINEQMKLAACRALAELARQHVPDSVMRAYGVKHLQFGPEYIIPKPFDPRVLVWVSSAVAKAAVDSGVARRPEKDFAAYRERLEASLSRSQQFMTMIRHRTRGAMKRIIFPDGESETVIRAVQLLQDEQMAQPVLVGDPQVITQRAAELGAKLDGAQILDPAVKPAGDRLARHFYEKRKRKGVTWADACYYAARPDWFASLLLDLGEVDGMVAGLSRSHSYVMKALLEVLPLREGVRRVTGLYLILTRDNVLLFADATAKVDPTAEELAETAVLAARVAKYFHIEPRVAMLSFSNFGSVRCAAAEKVRLATRRVRELDPTLRVDGEMRVDTAMSKTIQDEQFPFCTLGGAANVLVFPDLAAANIASQLITRVGGAESIGPLTLGLAKPVNVLTPASAVEDVVNATAVTAIECLDGTL